MSNNKDLVSAIGSAEEPRSESQLRFITCGSVDDGKSTLIGRMLFDSGTLTKDQLSSVIADSKKSGTQRGEIDYALLVDGLASEREQGITIDVAYRYFSTSKRKFIVADTPGHEQYTRNMATGASNSDLAIILVDARKGILPQTKRHSYIVSLLGIGQVVLAVNKMDMVGYEKETFDNIEEDFDEFAALLGEGSAPFESIAIPISALQGDNLVSGSVNMPWYTGGPLLSHLESVDVHNNDLEKPFRMPVQLVNRPNPDFRGYSGMISSGTVEVGDKIKILPAAIESTVSEVLVGDTPSQIAITGQSATLCLADEIDISRGDVIASAKQPCEVADQFDTTILWMSENPMLPGRAYTIKNATQTAKATITAPKFKVNINTLAHEPITKLEFNEIGECNIAVDRRLAFDHYTDNKDTGSFILIDRLSNETVGLGLIRFALRRASNIHWQSLDTDKKTRAEQKHQRPAVLWFTGLSGSGKSTIANILEKKLTAFGKHTYCLDGDNVRHGLNKDLGFTDADRVENIRRVTEVSKLMADAGLIALVSFISPFRSERRMARNAMDDGEFLEIYVDTPIEVAEQRDVKGLYKKARAGEIKNFTGIDSPYEPPQNPEIRLNTVDMSAEDAAELIIQELEERGIV